MPEAVGLVASIVGITSFAVQLTQRLYEVGATIATARQQINRLSRNVGLYRTVLELLADELNDNQPIYSQKALDFAALLRDNSDDFLRSIERLLPIRRGKRNDISVLNKITWSFKKSKIDLIIVELDRLKATVQLFVSVLALGHEYKAYSGQKSSPERFESMKTAFTNVQNMLVEHAGTTELAIMKRDKAQQDIEDDDEQRVALGNYHHRAQSSTALLQVVPTSPILLGVSSGNLSEACKGYVAQILRNSPNYALRLLREWTVVPAADDNNERDPLVTPRETPRLLTDKTQDRSRRAPQEYRSQDTTHSEAPIAKESFGLSSHDTQQRGEASKTLHRLELIQATPTLAESDGEIVLLETEKHEFRCHFAPNLIADGLLRVCDLEKYAAKWLDEDDYRNVQLTFKGTFLTDEGRPVAEYGVKHLSKIYCRIVGKKQKDRRRRVESSRNSDYFTDDLVQMDRYVQNPRVSNLLVLGGWVRPRPKHTKRGSPVTTAASS